MGLVPMCTTKSSRSSGFAGRYVSSFKGSGITAQLILSVFLYFFLELVAYADRRIVCSVEEPCRMEI